MTDSKTLCLGAVSTTATELVAMWYLSDGNSIALVTYTSLDPQSPATREELADTNNVVASIEFVPE